MYTTKISHSKYQNINKESNIIISSTIISLSKLYYKQYKGETLLILSEFMVFKKSWLKRKMWKYELFLGSIRPNSYEFVSKVERNQSLEGHNSTQSKNRLLLNLGCGSGNQDTSKHMIVTCNGHIRHRSEEEKASETH